MGEGGHTAQGKKYPGEVDAVSENGEDDAEEEGGDEQLQGLEVHGHAQPKVDEVPGPRRPDRVELALVLRSLLDPRIGRLPVLALDLDAAGPHLLVEVLPRLLHVRLRIVDGHARVAGLIRDFLLGTTCIASSTSTPAAAGAGGAAAAGNNHHVWMMISDDGRRSSHVEFLDASPAMTKTRAVWFPANIIFVRYR